MNHRIELSVDEILKRVYALSALRAYMKQDDKETALLTPDQRGALAETVSDVMIYAAGELMPRVEELDAGDNGNGTIGLTLKWRPAEATAGAVAAKLLEGAVTSGTIAAVLAQEDDDAAEEYREKMEKELNALNEIVDCSLGGSLLLKPYY